MGKRYYCEYCERSFKDDPEARKKHLSSLQHVKNRAHHYSQFRDPTTIHRVEAFRTGRSERTTRAEYRSHGAAALRRPRQGAIVEEDRAESSPRHPNPDDTIGEILAGPVSSERWEKIHYPLWYVRPELENHPDLPPSLWSIEPRSVTDSNFGKWGL